MTTSENTKNKGLACEAKGWGIPLVWNLAGGYQIDELPNGTTSIKKVLALHDNTMDECVKVFC